MPIASFSDKTALALFEGRRVKRISEALADRARERLAALDAATRLSDLASPGADLKKLKGDPGIWQMRVNVQWRIRFRVVRDDPLEVADV